MRLVNGTVLAMCATIFSAGVYAQAGGQMKPMAPMAPMLAAGDKAPDFTLARLDGKKVQLSALTKTGPVVVLMLRGWVGYQCPICNRQVGDFISHAKELEAAGANVALIYPGTADTVQAKAEDFVTGKTIPANMYFVVDPDLQTVNAYHLRWDAPNETAYPSTFLVDTAGVIRFAKVSRSHGDRSSAADVLAEIAKLKK